MLRVLGPDRFGITDQGRDDVIDDPAGLGRDKIGLVVGERVGDGHQRHAGQSQNLGLGPTERSELIAADHHGWHTQRIELNRVVDTPRRTATSIGDRENDRVA